MDKELQENLFNRFDNMFKERHLDMTQTCMCWGISCGNGWFKLLWELCENIEKVSSKQFRVTQVKEKFGELRFYTRPIREEQSPNKNEAIRKYISQAEEQSAKTCEVCGEPGSLRKCRGWYFTACEDHTAEREASCPPVS